MIKETMMEKFRNGDFSADITKYTIKHSHFETMRDYISLSHVYLSVEEIVRQFNYGFVDTTPIRLKCYKGYQMEEDLLKRIKAVYGDRIKTGIEIVAFDGAVKGHPDFTFDDYPSDCKSVLMDKWLPVRGILPKKIYWQMQAYMKYSGSNKALVIFESRESGKLADYWIRANVGIQNEIENKLIQVLQMK